MTFQTAIDEALQLFTEKHTHTQKWQGVDISNKPEMAMHEVLFHSFSRELPTEDLDYYRQDIAPNLPWADDHFLERVQGQPLNPGETWRHWPYNKSADTFRDDKGQFNHNYMERYWPRYAAMTNQGLLPPSHTEFFLLPHKGLRHEYGDLANVVDLLASEPDTRQAYFPIWFPEDTGSIHNGRKPCTIGYHFILREQRLNIVYYIRSCDFVRHFRDDIYLTVRLLLWMLDRLREINPAFQEVTPGQYVMHITSLHMFRNDYYLLKK